MRGAMAGSITGRAYSNRKMLTVGALLLASGLVMNYLLERHNIFKVWENSSYPISWADMLYPPLCVFLSLAGIALFVAGVIRRSSIPAFAIAVLVTIRNAVYPDRRRSLRRVPWPRPSCFKRQRNT